MPEGDKKDDLFEDLDKFFAPIQDVDWPESTTQAPVREHPEDQEVLEVPEAGAGPTEGQEGLFESPPEEEPSTGEARAEEEPGEEEAEEEPEEEEAEEISPESLRRPPAEYVDLPGPAEEIREEEVVAETVVVEEEPSEEAVEAAAEHFAESVRDEVELESEPESSLADVFAGTQEPIEEEIETYPEQPAGTGRVTRVGTEGLGGPSWQEPTTYEVGGEEGVRGTGRDLPAAFLTGLVLAILALGSLAIGDWAFALVAGAIVLWAQGELYLALQRHHLQPATALGLASGALILGAAYFSTEAAMLAMFALSVIATFLWYMAAPSSHRTGAAANIGVTVLGIAYVPLLAGYALAMLDFADGRALVVSVVGLTVVYDTAAFVVGSWWGSHPLAPTISPKKSVEGALGATLVVIAVSVGLVANYVDSLNTVGKSVGLAVAIAVMAPLGDLAESLLKRDLDLKDMGSILPGHGGVLDRIDSVLFVVPAAFLFLRLIFS